MVQKCFYFRVRSSRPFSLLELFRKLQKRALGNEFPISPKENGIKFHKKSYESYLITFIHPNTGSCNHCVTLGTECVESTGNSKKCLDFGYDADTNTCPTNCITMFPTTCDDCVTLGPECIRENGAEKRCDDLNWNKKKGCKKSGGSGICTQGTITECSQCEQMGKKCVKKTKSGKTCKNLGWNKHGCEWRVCRKYMY